MWVMNNRIKYREEQILGWTCFNQSCQTFWQKSHVVAYLMANDGIVELIQGT